MPKYEHPDWGDISDYIFVKGIITAVYPEDDTADVTVPGYEDGTGIPLFYHCSNDSEERSNGAIEGAASAFSAGAEDDDSDGDEVIVMCEAPTGEPVRIVGFVDGIRDCCFENWNGPDLCSKNQWYARVADESTPLTRIECPIDPGNLLFADTRTSFALEESRIKLSCWANDASDYSDIRVVTEAGDYRDILRRINARFVTLKLSAFATPDEGDNTAFVGLSITTDIGDVIFALDKGNGFVTDSWGWPDIGDNDGEEFTIDLDDYGISGPLVNVYFWLQSSGERRADLECDYICIPS